MAETTMWMGTGKVLRGPGAGLLLGLLTAAAVLATRVEAQSKAFDPRAYGNLVRHPTQVMVLGTMHLGGTPEDWDPGVLSKLMDRLAEFRPDAITIEALPGESVETLWRYREIYPEVARDYASGILHLAILAQTSLDMNAPEAEAEVRRSLARWPDQPTAAQRRRLAALFVASGDPNSALVQWWRLDPGDRVPGDGLSSSLVERLSRFAEVRNEGHTIGARLAARLGLERVYPVDDHSSDDVDIEHAADMEAFFSQAWVQARLGDPRFEAVNDATNRLGTPDQVLDTYRLVNSNTIALTEAGKLDAYLRDMLSRSGSNATGRAQIATLETRNLRQVANIREVASRYPGGRILVIIGFSHKPWFEAYLSMMTDVTIVDVADVLDGR